jgi:hypothetical protein
LASWRDPPVHLLARATIARRIVAPGLATLHFTAPGANVRALLAVGTQAAFIIIALTTLGLATALLACALGPLARPIRPLELAAIGAPIDAAFAPVSDTLTGASVTAIMPAPNGTPARPLAIEGPTAIITIPVVVERERHDGKPTLGPYSTRVTRRP